jgi:drug/metabolite transporter (DMT)-like permease
VSTVTETADETVARRSTGRVAAAAVLAVIGILCIVAAIIYFSEPAKSLPSILGAIKYNGHNLSRADDKRSVRGIGALVVGLIFLAGAWFAYAWKARERA